MASDGQTRPWRIRPEIKGAAFASRVAVVCVVGVGVGVWSWCLGGRGGLVAD
jgi:hypothetical protein